ncbi:MAG TPA: hypothetical protein ENN87_06450 [Phycisphaerales bacterium]|nr:hypothetical protein [Phycisphaerales bacterium]
MRTLGFILLTLAFLTGAVAAVWNKDTVAWPTYAPALAVGVAGVILLHLGHRRVHRAGDRVAAGLDRVRTCLDRIVRALAEIESQAATMSPYDVRIVIDRDLADDVAGFVEARTAIAHVHGLHAYATVMSDFAAAERYLNRAWSASADGYVDEVRTALTESLERFRRTQRSLHALPAA